MVSKKAVYLYQALEPSTALQKYPLKRTHREGNEFTFDADDLLAICVQHELDHLEGKLFC